MFVFGAALSLFMFDSAFGVSCNEDYWYYVIKGRLFWDGALAACRDSGGDLASIHSAEENEFLNSICNTDKCWIGLNDWDNEGEYVWSDGSDLDFLYWGVGEPDNTEWDLDVVYLGDASNGYWNVDGYGSDIGDAICKMMLCEPDETTVLLGMSFKSSFLIMMLFTLLICECVLMCCCAMLVARQRKCNFQKEKNIEMVFTAVAGENEGVDDL